MAPHLTLDLNGPFDARGEGGKTILPLSRRGQALLAYLAMQPRMTTSRAAVMTLLWGDRTEDQARASLRQELSVLRRALPQDTLVADRLNIWLQNTISEAPEEFEFLAGFDLSTPVFDDWLRDVRSAMAGVSVERRKTNRPSLVVMPFDTFGDRDLHSLPDGVVEEITGSLSRIRDFHVIARQSAYTLQRAQIDAVEAANRLGADYLVNGAVQKSGSNIRVSVQLIDGSTGRSLWVGKFDDHLNDLFEMLDRVALQVAGQISPHLREAEIRRSRTREPANRTAYDHLLRAYPHFWAYSKRDNLQALSHIGQALDTDSDYAHALALKAWCHAQHPIYMWSDTPEADRKLALDCASAAARAADQHAPTLTAIGAAYSIAGDDPDLALSYVNRALAIDPSNAWAWLRLGWHGVYTGDMGTTQKAFENALDLSPLDPFRFNMLTGRASFLMLWTDRYDEAVEILEESLRLNPTATWQYRELIPAYFKAGKQEKLKWAGARLMQAYPGLTVAQLSRSFAKINKKVDAQYLGWFVKAGIPEFD